MTENKNNAGNLKQPLNKLEGNIIKSIFENAEIVARLHRVISSPRGDYFRSRILQMSRTEISLSEIKSLKHQAELAETHRHLNKLLGLELIQVSKDGIYRRTDKGEQAINALKALETDVGQEEARRIFRSFLGVNSVKLFLRVYGNGKRIDLVKKEVKFTPQEIGKLSLFLPRSIEGLAAIDKLSDAELLIYRDDGNIYFNPKKARGFYKYLKSLYKTII